MMGYKCEKCSANISVDPFVDQAGRVYCHPCSIEVVRAEHKRQRDQIVALEAERDKLREQLATMTSDEVPVDLSGVKWLPVQEVQQAREKQSERIAALEAERDALREQLTAALNQRDTAQDNHESAMAIIGALITLVQWGAGDDSPEYEQALRLIGVVPSDDISDPAMKTCPQCGGLGHAETRIETPSYQSKWVPGPACDMCEGTGQVEDDISDPAWDRGGLDPLSADTAAHVAPSDPKTEKGTT